MLLGASPGVLAYHPQLQRATFGSGLQGKRHHVGLRLAYRLRVPAEPPQPAGGTPATLSKVENVPRCFTWSMLRPHLQKSLALDILAEEGYMSPGESVQSREMRTAPGCNICFEKRLRKSSLFSAPSSVSSERRLQGDPATAFETEPSKRQAQRRADYPLTF